MAGFLGSISGTVVLDTRKAVAAYAALRAQNARTVYALRGTGESFTKTGQVMVGAGALMVYAFGKAVIAAAEFERKMDFFAAVTDTNKQKMGELSEFTLQLAQDTIYSADQIAEGFIELGKAGVSAEGIMNGIGKAMANLGAAGDIPLMESGQIITSTIQQFDLSAQKAVKVTDLLAGAANASIADITDIGVSLKYVGGVANAAGLTLTDTTTAISLLAKAGIRGSTAGTSLRQMIVSLGGATGPATQQLEELGIITKDGTNLFFTAEGKAKSLSQVFQILQDHTQGLTQKQKLMALRTIFNNRALSAASILTREGAKGFREMNNEMKKTTAADVAAKRMDNLSGDIEILRGNIETLMIQAGGPFQEVFRGWVQGLTKVVQKFGELDPATQKVIVQTWAFIGVGLILVGLFNILIGTSALFVANLIKLGAALKFVYSIGALLVRALIAIGAALVGAIGATAAIVLAVILALAVAFYFLYTRSETFRNAVNHLASEFVKGLQDMWSIIKTVGKALKTAFTNPGKIWDAIVDGATTAGQAIQDFAAGIFGWLVGGLSSGASAVGQFVMSIIGWFAALPGRVLGAVASFVARVAQLLTFQNVAYAVGFMIGRVIRYFLQLATFLFSIVPRISQAVIGFFQAMGNRIASFFARMVARTIATLQRWAAAAPVIAARVATGIISFLKALPGRVTAFFVRMTVRAIAQLQRLASSAQENAARILANIVNALAGLPARVASFFVRMYLRAVAQLNKLVHEAWSAGLDIYNKINSGITGLPSLVSGIIGRMVSAFTGAIRSAYDAAKSVAGSLWKGFKDGLGINSPSYIEHAMWAITDTVDAETKNLRRGVMAVQDLGNRIAKQKVGIGGIDPALKTLADLSTQAQIRVSASGNLGMTGAGDIAAKQAAAEPKKQKLIDGQLRLDPSGRAFIQGVAEDADDADHLYDDSLERMNR